MSTISLLLVLSRLMLFVVELMNSLISDNHKIHSGLTVLSFVVKSPSAKPLTNVDWPFLFEHAQSHRYILCTYHVSSARNEGAYHSVNFLFCLKLHSKGESIPWFNNLRHWIVIFSCWTGELLFLPCFGLFYDWDPLLMNRYLPSTIYCSLSLLN